MTSPLLQLDQRPLTNYMEKMQHDITPSMRGILIDWLVEVSISRKSDYVLTKCTGTLLHLNRRKELFCLFQEASIKLLVAFSSKVYWLSCIVAYQLVMAITNQNKFVGGFTFILLLFLPSF